jgi:acyl carrier protein
MDLNMVEKNGHVNVRVQKNMEQDIKQQIIDFISANFLFDDTQKGINEKASLLETGVIDSTGVLELIAYIEETYGRG